MILNDTQRAVTLKGVWDSEELSFKAIELSGGKKLCKSVLILEIAKMVMLLKADLQELQIDYMADYILQHYYSYTISDITCLTDRMVKVKPYGKPNLQNLIYELNQYSIEKQEYAVEQRVKENSKHKADHQKENKFTKMYAKMKANAKEPKTQKQKDKENKIANNKRIEEMERLFPDNEKTRLLKNM